MTAYAASGARIVAPNIIRTCDGVNLFYRDWGEGKPVLFVAGWSLPSDQWNYQMLALLEQGARVIAFDRRGHGRSSDPGRGYTLDTLADDLSAVLEALDLHEVTLVSHSMGCNEVVRYLSRHGSGRIQAAALLGTMTGPGAARMQPRHPACGPARGDAPHRYSHAADRRHAGRQRALRADRPTQRAVAAQCAVARVRGRGAWYVPHPYATREWRPD